MNTASAWTASQRPADDRQNVLRKKHGALTE